MVKFLILQTVFLFHFLDCLTLRNLWSKNAGNIIFSHLNINSMRNKFENLFKLVAGNVDILCIAETKLDLNTWFS